MVIQSCPAVMFAATAAHLNTNASPHHQFKRKNEEVRENDAGRNDGKMHLASRCVA